jgi:transcriptional regulator with XRE-family HTH domain
MDALPDNLRRLRKAAGMTQADLATAAGLPRNTVANLEQPDLNPSLATVVAVAKALDVGLDELVTPVAAERHYTTNPASQQVYRAEGGDFTSVLLSPIASSGVQVHRVTMAPGCRSVGRPHPKGAQEFFTTLSGTAVLTIDEDVVTLPAGHLVQFPGHHRHVYANPGKIPVEAVSVVVLHL